MRPFRILRTRASGRWTATLPVAWAVLPLAALLVTGCATGKEAGLSGPQGAVPAAARPAPPERPRMGLGVLPADPGAYYHFMRGYRMELDRSYDLALSEYLSAQSYAPDDLELIARIADLYLKNGDVRGAIEMAEKGLDIAPGMPELLHFLSSLYLKEGDFSMAVITYRRLLEHNPDDIKVYYLLALAYVRESRFEDALGVVAEARQRDPSSGLPDYYVGRVYKAQGENNRALDAFRTATRKEPMLEAAWLDQADLYEQWGREEKAREVYETVLSRVNPDSAMAHDRLIQIYLKEGDLDQVLAHLDAMLLANPRNPSLLYRQAVVLSELKRLDEAIQALTRVLALYPSDIRSMEFLGGLYEQAERPEDARTTYQQILELEPDYYKAHMHMGYLSDRLGDEAGLERAVQAVAAYLDENPEDATPYRFVGWGHMQAGNYPAAVEVLERAVALEPDNVELHFSLGAAHYEAKNPEQVESEMRWVLERSPEHASALNFLGYFYAERGERLDEAVKLIQKALKLRPDDGFFIDSLAWAYYQQGRLAEALKLQKEAVAKAPQEDGTLYDHLGTIHLGLGHTESAREAWLSALRLKPDNDDLRARFRAAGMGDPDQEVPLPSPEEGQAPSQAATAP